jgi:hypothetical protein
VWINEDNAHFYDQHPPEAMTEAGVRGLVDRYTDGTNVRGLLLCVNVQRALFDSRAWEPLWADYDPDGPDNQPCLASQTPEAASMKPDQRGRYWIHQLWLLKQRGVDHPAVWLDQCRQRGVAGWLTMRMNDCHHNDDERSFWHSTLWKTRPDLRRCPHRDGDWFESAFDYGQPEVVEHHLALLRELCERYDFDGIELDWSRWVRHFKPGHERAGTEVLTDVMREARRLTEAATERQGRPVRIGVRLPTDPQACLDLGYDVVTWGRERLVDVVTLAPFFQQTEFDWPVEMWRALLGDQVKLLCQPEAAIRPYPEVGSSECFVDHALLFGSSASALEAGADGVYLFNECYRMAPGDGYSRRDPSLVGRLLGDSGDLEGMRDAFRRHPVSYHQVVAPGAGHASPLPVPLQKPAGSWSFGRHGDVISLRIDLGPRPVNATLQLELGFDTPQGDADCEVWLNGSRLDRPARPLDLRRPRTAIDAHAFDAPLEAANPGINLVELQPSPTSPGSLVWAELIVSPDSP